jgi:hypothetical protein
MKNRTQIEIDEQTQAFMAEVENLNHDFHDNCDMNICAECIGTQTLDQMGRKIISPKQTEVRTWNT